MTQQNMAVDHVKYCRCILSPHIYKNLFTSSATHRNVTRLSFMELLSNFLQNMKFSWLGIHKSFLLLIIFVVFSHGWSLSEVMGNHDAFVSLQGEKAATRDEGEMMYPYGSSLPDCSHACGACFPCKRVIVSFKCSSAESCPIVYRCMCKGKYYHVPSN